MGGEAVDILCEGLIAVIAAAAGPGIERIAPCPGCENRLLETIVGNGDRRGRQKAGHHGCDRDRTDAEEVVHGGAESVRDRRMTVPGKGGGETAVRQGHALRCITGSHLPSMLIWQVDL